jgi:hypothetical protein
MEERVCFINLDSAFSRGLKPQSIIAFVSGKKGGYKKIEQHAKRAGVTLHYQVEDCFYDINR